MNELIKHIENTQAGSLIKAIQSATLEVARRNTELITADDLPETAKYAVLVVERIKALNGVDLVTVLERGRLINELLTKNLLGIHPGGYSSLEEMAQDQGISLTELSQTRDLCEVIFPYLVERGYNIYQLWEEIGKSKFKELVPLLKALITGKPSGTRSAREAIEKIIEEIGGEGFEDQDTREDAIDYLITQGSLLTNAQLREHIRPERTNPIPFFVAKNGKSYAVFTRLSEEDLNSLMARLGRAADFVFRNDPRTAQTIHSLIGGEHDNDGMYPDR